MKQLVRLREVTVFEEYYGRSDDKNLARAKKRLQQFLEMFGKSKLTVATVCLNIRQHELDDESDDEEVGLVQKKITTMCEELEAKLLENTPSQDVGS